MRAPQSRGGRGVRGACTPTRRAMPGLAAKMATAPRTKLVSSPDDIVVAPHNPDRCQRPRGSKQHKHSINMKFYHKSGRLRSTTLAQQEHLPPCGAGRPTTSAAAKCEMTNMYPWQVLLYQSPSNYCAECTQSASVLLTGSHTTHDSTCT